MTLYPTQSNPLKIGLNNLAVWSIQRAPCHQASVVAQLVKNLPAVRDTWVRSLGWEDPLKKGKVTHSRFWPGEFHGLYSPWCRKESDMAKQLSLTLPSEANLKPIDRIPIKAVNHCNLWFHLHPPMWGLSI